MSKLMFLPTAASCRYSSADLPANRSIKAILTKLATSSSGAGSSGKYGDGDQEPGDGDHDGDQELGDGDHQSGDGDQELGDGDQELGDGDHEAGDGDQELGDGDQNGGSVGGLVGALVEVDGCGGGSTAPARKRANE